MNTIANIIQWQYFYPIQQGMPKNCSADISRVIDHLDSVLTFGSKSEVHKLKAQFGLEGVQHNDDFAVYVLHCVGYLDLH